MPRVINAGGQFDGSQARLDGLLTAAMMEVYLGSIGLNTHLKGQVYLALSDSQGTSEGRLGSIVVTLLQT